MPHRMVQTILEYVALRWTYEQKPEPHQINARRHTGRTPIKVHEGLERPLLHAPSARWLVVLGVQPVRSGPRLREIVRHDIPRDTESLFDRHEAPDIRSQED